MSTNAKKKLHPSIIEISFIKLFCFSLQTQWIPGMYIGAGEIGIIIIKRN